MAVRSKSRKLYCRHRIAKMLYSVLDAPMTLIVAQMGYGKTSSLTSFLSRRKDVGLFSLAFTEAMQEESALWDAFCQAVSVQRPELGAALLSGGMPHTLVEMEQAATLFQLRLDGLNILLIDDLPQHVNPDFGRFLVALAESRPEHLCTVVLSRKFPDFIAPSFFYSGDCGVIGQTELSFTPDEIVEYFAAFGCTLTEQEIKKAEQMAEGWPLAVILLCEEYQRTGFLRQPRESVLVVKNAVLDQLTPQEQLLFARLSLFDNFTMEQAIYVTQDRKTRYQLLRLYQEGCFLEVEEGADVYRLHPLMRAAAREGLPLLENDLNQLYYRCASWYDIHEQRLEALYFYRLTQNETRVYELLNEPYATELVNQDPVAVHEAFPEITARSRRKYALAMLADIYAQLVYLNLDEGLRQLKELRASFEETNKKSNMQNQVLGELWLLESLSQIDDLDALVRCRQEAENCFQGGRSVLFPRTIGCLFGSPSILWRYHRKPGALRETADHIAEVFRGLTMYAENAIPAAGWLARAEYAYFTADLESAAMHAYRAIYEARPRGQFDIHTAALFVLAQASLMKGEYDNAHVYLGELRRVKQQSTVPPGARAAISYVVSCMGKAEYMDAELMVPSFNGFVMKIVEGRRLLYQKYDIQLEMFAENMLVEPNAGVFERLYGYLYLAAAKERLGEPAYADKALEQAVRLAAPDRLVAPFVENAPFLNSVLSRSTNPFVAGLLPQVEGYLEKLEEFKHTAAGYSLSNTEMQIIRWYASGCKQGEVARNLNLSVTEVRRTINDIYRKIGVADINEIAALVLR